MSWNSRTNRISIKWVNHNGWIDIFVIKKLLFFVRIFDISLCVFTEILIGRACWMQNLIPHPTRTHTAYFWWPPLPQRQEIPKKMWYLKKRDDDVIITFFSGISCFWGSRVLQKYAMWVLIGCRIKFHIQQALPIEIWVKVQGDM